MATQTRPRIEEQTQAQQSSLLLLLVALGAAVALLVPMFGSIKSGSLISEQTALYASLILYGAAAALYIGFGVTGVERYVRAASLATWGGFIANTLAAAHRWYLAGRPPFSNIYEMLLSFVWTVAALTLFLERRYGVKVVGTVTMPLAVIGVLLMQLLPSTVRPLVPALQSTWLHIHVTFAMLSYAACAVSFALAMMFLIQDRLRTPVFMAATSGFLALTYAGIATRVKLSGVMQVVAWHSEDGHELFVEKGVPLMVNIPDLGWLFLMVLVAVTAPLAIYLWNPGKDERGFAWANRLFFIATLLQGLALAAFALRVRGGQYASSQAEGLFETAPAASPFILAGMVGGLFASMLYLMLVWRRPALERMLPDSVKLDWLTYKTIGIAFPLLTLMIAAGAYWANRTWGSYWSWDPKETWALITWLAYAGYLHMRIARGWRGRRAAYFAIIGFAVVLFTFFGVTYLLPGLHAYA